MSGQIRVPKGLYGVAVAETKIAKSEPDGSLVYRGYRIEELAGKATFEETAYLILNGDLPNRGELELFTASMRSGMRVDGGIYDLVRAMPERSHPMDVLRTAVSALGCMESGKDMEDMGLSIASKMTPLAANGYRIPRGEKVQEPMDDVGFASNFMYMITGRVPESWEAWVFERVLIFYMEHDLNASAFAVRVVASTLADRYAAVTAGLAALKGRLHGGANEAAMEMLLNLREPERGRDYVAKSLERGEKVVGFGHRVYKKIDPRAQLCKEYLKEYVKRRKEFEWLYPLCVAMEEEMWSRKKLPANLDFYAAPLFYMMGIPIPLYTPIFAASRVFGWMAHYNEQLEDNKIIRPDAVYVGPSSKEYVPLESR
jgi:citrate synthase